MDAGSEGSRITSEIKKKEEQPRNQTIRATNLRLHHIPQGLLLDLIVSSCDLDGVGKFANRRYWIVVDCCTYKAFSQRISALSF